MQLKPIKEGLKYSIIIVSYNTIEALSRCVSSVFNNTKNFELIIVDNGSMDGSVGYIINLQGLQENVKVIENGTNLNFGPANNQGLALAEGERIILLNSDTAVTPGWAESLETCLTHDGNIAMVGPVCSNSNGRQMVGNIVPEFGPEINIASLNWTNKFPARYLNAGVLYGWCMYVSREFLDKEEYLFDPRFKNAYEDNDLSHRAILRGMKLFIDYGNYIFHEGQATFRKNPKFKTDYIKNGEVNQDLFYQKYSQKKENKLIAVYRIANCEKYIRESMERTSEFADEIICLFARSQDKTKEIALSFPKVTVWEEWNEEDHPFDEQAERNWLLQQAIKRNADWVISIDGDEIYEKKFIDMAPRLMRNVNPHTLAYWCNWRTIWHREDGKEYYRVDSTFGQFQNYRFFKVLPGLEIKKNTNIYNHHCGSAPIYSPENLKWINVRVKHLGYDTKEQRKKKHAFYKKADPRPVSADVGNSDYHHLIDNDVKLKEYREDNKLSVMTVIKNEEDYIYQMLDNVKSIADEIVIIDNGSTDGTRQQIERFKKHSMVPVRVFDGEFQQDEKGMLLNYSQAKNFGKSKCRGEWILQMDADELFKINEIGHIFGFIDEGCIAYLVSVINYLEPPRSLNPKDQVYSVSETMRLYRNIPEIFYSGLIHESLEDSVGAMVRSNKGKAIVCPIQIHHRGYLRGKDKIREKADRYHKINETQFEVSGKQDPRSIFNMALHYMNDGNIQKGIEYYQKAIELEPQFWRAKQNMAWYHLNEAKQQLTEMQKDIPKVYMDRTTKLKEIMELLNKFDFSIRKVC